MARLNVYLPDDVAQAAREADLNVSALTRAAVTEAFAQQATNRWLASLPRTGKGPSHEEAMEALDAAREELGA